MDLNLLNQASRTPNHNAWLAHGGLPRCARVFDITAAPSLPTLCGAQSAVVPRELCEQLDLAAYRGADWIEQHVPVQMRLTWHKQGARRNSEFAVMLYVRSIDLEPELNPLHWALWGCRHNDSLRGLVLIRGAFQVIGHDPDAPPEMVRGDDTLLECLIAYHPRASIGSGSFGVVLPTDASFATPSGIIKDLEVLGKVLALEEYQHGFMEVHAPNGEVRWGRIKGTSDRSWVEVDALLLQQRWLYRSRERDNLFLNLIGTEWTGQGNCELLGDAVLCSDGTIVHNYYFDRVAYEASHGSKSNLPNDWHSWRSGYCFNRFYPKGSQRIPEEVTHSFEREAPDWFLK